MASDWKKAARVFDDHLRQSEQRLARSFRRAGARHPAYKDDFEILAQYHETGASPDPVPGAYYLPQNPSCKITYSMVGDAQIFLEDAAAHDRNLRNEFKRINAGRVVGEVAFALRHPVLIAKSFIEVLRYTANENEP